MRTAIVVVIAILLRGGVGATSRESQSPACCEGFAPLVSRTMAAIVTIVSSKDNLGSGVIVSPQGHILTNLHVVEGASQIKVFLSDNREFHARLLGSDPKTDIAVLKIDVAAPPVLALGNSSSVRTGDFVLAMGAPFGLRQSVTMGIISATGRGGLGVQDYEDFIQTDAVINFGSSGGALINMHGELIGISTAGRSEYRGVGFAVPIDMVRSVMDQILKHGRVIRAWLGATVQPLDAATAKAFGLPAESRGALVADVPAGSPAYRAGLLAGDIITEVNGKSVRDDRDLNRIIGSEAPGVTVRLKAYRERHEKEFMATLTEEPTSIQPRARSGQAAGFSSRLGLTVQNTTGEDSPKSGHRVIVVDLSPGGPADEADVLKGDIIVEINRRSIMNVEDFHAVLRDAKAQSTLLLIERSGTRLFILVETK